MNKVTRATVWVVSLVIFAVGASSALATKPSPGHQVWVCKYVGQPGDFETLKPGKQPIIVDVAAADAYVGADFADGQTHSVVIDLATDSNTGQGERYTGEATCPTVPSETPVPTPTPVATPSPSDPSATPTPVLPTPTPTATTTDTPSASPSGTPVVTPSGSPKGTPMATPTPSPAEPVVSSSPKSRQTSVPNTAYGK